MNKELAAAIAVSLNTERQLFHYFKDRYVLDFVHYEMERKKVSVIDIAELKKSRLKKFAKKPILTEVFKHNGSGRLHKIDLPSFWPVKQFPFVVTFDTWGMGERKWDQTSRNQANLVLQLNFNSQHIREYQKLIKPSSHINPFEYRGHPVARGKRKTMSWVRMDIDVETQSVLIEEIQTDWLKEARIALERVKKHRRRLPYIKPRHINRHIQGDYEDLAYYVENTLLPYQRIWAEASLLAAIDFIRHRLQFSTIYYHSFETGMKIKLTERAPPRSLYTQLPRQFGFELTSESPEFLRKDKYSSRYLRAIKDTRWFKLAV